MLFNIAPSSFYDVDALFAGANRNVFFITSNILWDDAVVNKIARKNRSLLLFLLSKKVFLELVSCKHGQTPSRNDQLQYTLSLGQG